MMPLLRDLLRQDVNQPEHRDRDHWRNHQHDPGHDVGHEIERVAEEQRRVCKRYRSQCSENQNCGRSPTHASLSRSITSDDADLELIETGCAAGIIEIDPMPLVT